MRVRWFRPAYALTGGGAGALDAIDGAELVDKDAAFVVTGGGVYVYSLDADSGSGESSPDVIAPDSNAGDKRWVLQAVVPPIAGAFMNFPVATFSDGDATPSVAGANVFKTANTGPTTITGFDDGVPGQPICVIFGDGNTTIDFSGTDLKGNAGADYTGVADDLVAFVTADGTTWYAMGPFQNT